MRKSAMLWLIPGVLFGLITLGGLAAGGYWINLTHSKVQEIAEKVDDGKKEVDRLKGTKRAGDLAKAVQEEERLQNEAGVELPNAERERLIAIIISSTAVIPGLLTLVFLVMGVLRFMQKPKQPRSADDEEEDEENEEPEKPSVKKSVAAKPKPDDEDE